MRKELLSSQSRILAQVAVIAILAGATAACSGDSGRFNGPMFTGSTPNQQMIIGGSGQPMPAPINNDVMPPTSQGSVSSSQLPPPPGGYQQSSNYSQPAPYQQPVLPGVRQQPQAMASATTTQPLDAPAYPIKKKKPGTAGWSAENGTTVTLQPGETLASVSRRYNVPVKEIAAANNISNPSLVGVGTRLVIPSYGAAGGAQVASAQSVRPVESGRGGMQLVSGPKAAGMQASADAAPINGVHTVGPGQTLSSIARLYNVSPKALADANQLTSANQVHLGQKLRIPGHNAPQPVAMQTDPTRRELKPKGEDPNANPLASNAPAKQPGQGGMQLAKGPQPIDTAPQATASIQKPESAAPQPAAYTPPADAPKAADAVSDPGSANGTTFRWPVRGRIIAGFGTAATGDKNDGINLAVPEGTSIKSVEAGTVIYSGSELEGYGNLVLVRHADGWVSAYAHNSDLLVKKGDTVRRGQIIARAGSSGNVSSPQLHFELRRGSKPVNPLDYLQG